LNFSSCLWLWGTALFKGSGTISLDTQTLNLKGTTESFPFEQLARAFVPVPEMVLVRHTGDWAWAGTLAQWTSHLNGQIKNGFTPDQTIESAIHASFNGPEGEIEANLSHPRAEVWGKGALDLQKKSLDADFKMAVSSFPAFKALWENLGQVSGSVSLGGRVAGDWENLGGSVHFVGKGLGYQGFGVQSVRADFKRKTKGPSPLRLKVLGSSVTWVKADGGVGHLPQVEGSWAGTEIQGNLQWNVMLAQGISVGGQGPAHRKNGGMGWAWDQLTIHFPQGNEYVAEPGGSIERDATGGIAITGLRWEKNGQSLRFKTLGYENGTMDVEAFA
jgi:autotransporter translocation and assembly factor TamB